VSLALSARLRMIVSRARCDEMPSRYSLAEVKVPSISTRRKVEYAPTIKIKIVFGEQMSSVFA